MKNLILVGSRGAGKSKISRVLSKHTQLPIVSTDSIAIYKLGGIPIPYYISSGGSWKEFRELEYQILLDLKSANGILIDCGGGILFDLDDDGKEIFSYRKTQILKSLGTIVYLQQPLDYLYKKVEDDPTRPSLSHTRSYEEILKFRLPYYESSADFTVDISGLNKEKAGEKILRTLRLL